MYVRDARNRDEVWLLDHIEEMGLDDTAFRSRDYVVAVDEETGDRAGFGRFRVHKVDGEPTHCELTSVGVLGPWRGQGVGAHVVERLLAEAGDEDFDTVYSLTDRPEYLVQFGFDPIDVDALPAELRERLRAKRESIAPEAVPMAIGVGDFEMPPRLRRRFKDAAPAGDEDPAVDERAEDFGIDPDSATYKYDTGRR
ncbi:GNAT family N-acetyltransferase [Halobacteriales archaeon QS_1_68_20]|nr:MAG: GNAT family N-acetyltransferase [Halobacteriales archaeon QS_1_68_20]